MGFELRVSDRRGEGVFATISFVTGEIVMVGMIEKSLEANHSHASQIGINAYVLHAGLISKVNHSCDPNCGIGINDSGAHDFIAIRDIAVDEEMGVVAMRMNFGRGSTFSGSDELDVWHSFKIYDGLIHAAEAYCEKVPMDSKYGWE